LSKICRPTALVGTNGSIDYKIDQLDVRGSCQGMVLVDGAWYCRAMSESLMNATKDFRDYKRSTRRPTRAG
jgi:hypothetical protein